MSLPQRIQDELLDEDPPHDVLWRQQCARNLMECYALGMEGLGAGWGTAGAGHAALEALTRLMVDGMTSARGVEDEKSFYRTASALCRECGRMAGDKAAFFRVYAAVFEDLAGEEESHEADGK